jgi:hypothetical protein
LLRAPALNGWKTQENKSAGLISFGTRYPVYFPLPSTISGCFKFPSRWHSEILRSTAMSLYSDCTLYLLFKTYNPWDMAFFTKSDVLHSTGYTVSVKVPMSWFWILNIFLKFERFNEEMQYIYPSISRSANCWCKIKADGKICTLLLIPICCVIIQ